MGLVSIGFSNTTMEFQKFLQLLKGVTLPPTLAVVDGEIGGRDAPMWEATDYQLDHLHPNPSTGQEKVARRLLELLQTNETSKPWFVGK